MNEEVKLKIDDLVIGALPCTAVELVWDKIEPLLETARATAPNDVDMDVVKDRLLAGTNMAVTISRGSDIIAVNVFDVKVLDTGIRVLYVPLTAGSEMDLWLDRFLEITIALAKDYNCTEIRGLATRQGWLRKLKPYGWEDLFTTMRYEIGE